MNENSIKTIQINYQENSQPDLNEFHGFFENVFLDLSDNTELTEDQQQTLDEWFSVEEMISYLSYGKLIEARSNDGNLVGAIFIAKQHPLSWPDGNKMEIFIIGIDIHHRGHDIGRKLVKLAEDYAQRAGSKKIVVSTHVAMRAARSFYLKMGYEERGILKDYYDNGDAIYFQKF